MQEGTQRIFTCFAASQRTFTTLRASTDPLYIRDVLVNVCVQKLREGHGLFCNIDFFLYFPPPKAMMQTCRSEMATEEMLALWLAGRCALINDWERPCVSHIMRRFPWITLQWKFLIHTSMYTQKDKQRVVWGGSKQGQSRARST